MDYCEDFVEIDLGEEEEDYSEALSSEELEEPSESNVSDELSIGSNEKPTEESTEETSDANDSGQNIIVETKHDANEFAETNILPSVKQIGQADTTKKHLFDKFYKYLSKQDVKNVRRMLRDYNIFVNLDTRDLNNKYPLDDYKFTKRKGALTLYKPVKQPSPTSYALGQSPTMQTTMSIKPTTITPVAERPLGTGDLFSEKSLVLHMDNKIADIELSVSEFVKTMEACIQNLENRLDNYRDGLNKVIGIVNANTTDTNDNTNKISIIANVVDIHAKAINNILKHFQIY